MNYLFLMRETWNVLGRGHDFPRTFASYVIKKMCLNGICFFSFSAYTLRSDSEEVFE